VLQVGPRELGAGGVRDAGGPLVAGERRLQVALRVDEQRVRRVAAEAGRARDADAAAERGGRARDGGGEPVQ